jgi:cell division protein FtsQ
MHAPHRPNLRLLVATVALAGLLVGGWLVLRDSGLVAVREVEVVGLSGPQEDSIRAALTTAGRDMTTLHLRPEILRSAVAEYVVVKDLSAERDVPHGLRITVTERVPVAKIVSSETAVPVAGDGTVLRGTTADDVPELKLPLPPAGDTVTDRRTLVAIALLARAPAPLRKKVTTAFRGPRGLTVRLAAGPSVHFGTSDRLAAKWASLAAVLASPDSRGATVIDVRVPEHPAAAGLEQAAPQQGQLSSGT